MKDLVFLRVRGPTPHRESPRVGSIWRQARGSDRLISRREVYIISRDIAVSNFKM